jgi:hypothetical protein
MSERESPQMQPTEVSPENFSNLAPRPIRVRGRLGQQVRLKCGEHQFTDKLDLVWRQDGDDIRQSHRFSNELTLRQLGLKDAGLYECLIGNHVLTSIDLDVDSSSQQVDSLGELRYQSAEHLLTFHILGLAGLVLVTLTVGLVKDSLKSAEIDEQTNSEMNRTVFDFVRANTNWLNRNLDLMVENRLSLSGLVDREEHAEIDRFFESQDETVKSCAFILSD